MADLLNIGTTGLLSLQRALSTTSNNVVNANTEGYSRQLINFEALPGQRLGNGYVGSGVTTSTIQRAYDAHLTAASRELSSSFGANDTLAAMLGRLEDMLADAESGVGQHIQQFFDSLNGLAQNPTGSAERQVVLAEAGALTRRVGDTSQNMVTLQRETADRIRASVVEVNDIAARLAEVNDTLLGQQGGAGASMVMLDERDLLLDRLAALVDIDSKQGAGGSVDVFIGKGQSLVIGSQATLLATGANAYDPEKVNLLASPGAGVAVDISRQLEGGEIGGLLDFQNRQLGQALDQLGLVTLGLATSVNAQHRLGLDASGRPGADFFAIAPPAAISSNRNAGSAVLAVNIDSVADLRATGYTAQFDGAAWQVTRDSDGSLVSGPGGMAFDGLSLTVTGTPAVGDSFRIEATRTAPSTFRLLLGEGTGIAASGPVRQTVSKTNLGTLAVKDQGVTSAAGLPLAAAITLTFDLDALGPGQPGFLVAGSAAQATIAFDPSLDSNGKRVTIEDAGGLTLELSGEPRPGDQLTINNNTQASADNRNATALSMIAGERFLAGTSTLGQAFGNLIARVGTQTQQASVRAATDERLLIQARAARDSVAGVNLDEEAANLMRFQQAYQAAAQLVAAADDMFQVLLGATRR
ncbi:MAG: flagellar hook-associated protein FlgK [Pseudomonadota bacterium]